MARTPDGLNIIFVFGTLKRGFANHDEGMKGQLYLGEAMTVDAWPMLVAGQWFSPVMIPEKGVGHRVKGELYAVNDAALAELDRIESVHLPDGYRRYSIAVEYLDGRGGTQAFVYMKDRSLVKIIHSEPMADYQDRRYVHKSQRPVSA